MYQKYQLEKWSRVSAISIALIACSFLFSCASANRQDGATDESEVELYRKYVTDAANTLLVEVPSDSWITIPIAAQITVDHAWKVIVETLGETFSMELLDSQTHYLRTGWKQVTYPLPQNPSWSLGYQSRAFCRFATAEKAFKIKFETFLYWVDSWVPLKYIFREDFDILEEIRGRISG